MSDKLPKKVASFVAANDASAVIGGSAFVGGGGQYDFESGKSMRLTLEECRALPVGYPKWPWDFDAALKEETAR